MFACIADWSYPHSETIAQTLAYGLPFSNLGGREPLAVFLCQCHSSDGSHLSWSSKFVAPLIGLTPAQRRLWIHSADEFHPKSKSYRIRHFAARIVPTQSPESATPLMGLTPLEDYCGPTLLMGFTPTQSPAKFIVPLMSLTPTQRQNPTPLLGSPSLGFRSL